jgi:hypothetical protein
LWAQHSFNNGVGSDLCEASLVKRLESCENVRYFPLEVRTSELSKGKKHGEGGGTNQEDSSKETVVEGRLSIAEEHGSQGAADKDRESSQADRGRDAAKGDKHRHLAANDRAEARAGKEALSVQMK